MGMQTFMLYNTMISVSNICFSDDRGMFLYKLCELQIHTAEFILGTCKIEVHVGIPVFFIVDVTFGYI
jgi:hypothetical protein